MDGQKGFASSLTIWAGAAELLLLALVTFWGCEVTADDASIVIDRATALGAAIAAAVAAAAAIWGRIRATKQIGLTDGK